MRIESFWLLAVVVVLTSPAFADTLVPKEVVQQCHMKMDVAGNLVMDDTPECKSKLSSAASANGPAVRSQSRGATSSATVDERLKRAQQEYRREHRTPVIPATSPPATPPTKSSACDTGKLYIRADSLDNFMYQSGPAAADAKGASVSYTNDRVGSQQTATVSGMVSYILGNPCLTTPLGKDPFLSGYIVAPWVYANGTWNDPAKKTDSNVAKVGTTLQFEVSRTSIFDRYYASISPYYLTDFQGKASAEGVALYWEPSQIDWHLGSTIVTNDYVGWFWQVRAEGDFRDVQTPGFTNLANGNYEWLGGTARLNIFLFPITTSVPPFLQDRISLIGTTQYYWDTNHGIDVRNYSAQIKYKLAPCKAPDKTEPANTASSDCTIAGSSSISFEYDHGTDKDTLVFSNKYLLKLDYAY